jgi:tRNA A37 threonylcarbamoyladenosine modification protein TsaB
MEIIITIKERTVRLALCEKKREIDFAAIADERSLAEKLLPAIDRLLERNKLTAREVRKIRIESDQGDTFTTTRIARTVETIWNPAWVC